MAARSPTAQWGFGSAARSLTCRSPSSARSAGTPVAPAFRRGKRRAKQNRAPLQRRDAATVAPLKRRRAGQRDPRPPAEAGGLPMSRRWRGTVRVKQTGSTPMVVVVAPDDLGSVRWVLREPAPASLRGDRLCGASGESKEAWRDRRHRQPQAVLALRNRRRGTIPIPSGSRACRIRRESRRTAASGSRARRS